MSSKHDPSDPVILQPGTFVRIANQGFNYLDGISVVIIPLWAIQLVGKWAMILPSEEDDDVDDVKYNSDPGWRIDHGFFINKQGEWINLIHRILSEDGQIHRLYRELLIPLDDI